MDKQDPNNPPLKVGLLGGSFNPAHEGHLEISLKAIEKLGLDQVWWLVSPQNPLKTTDNIANYDQRFQNARDLVSPHKNIIISDLEKTLSCTYTIDSLTMIKEKFPHHQFVWLMGGDNLEQLPQWHKWHEIVALLPIAIFNRPTYCHDLDQSILMQHYAQDRLPDDLAMSLITHSAPCWLYIAETQNPLSATHIRALENKL